MAMLLLIMKVILLNIFFLFNLGLVCSCVWTRSASVLLYVIGVRMLC